MHADILIMVNVKEVRPDVALVEFLTGGGDEEWHRSIEMWLPVGKYHLVPLKVNLPDPPQPEFSDPFELDENLDAEDDIYDGGER